MHTKVINIRGVEWRVHHNSDWSGNVHFSDGTDQSDASVPGEVIIALARSIISDRAHLIICQAVDDAIERALVHAPDGPARAMLPLPARAACERPAWHLPRRAVLVAQQPRRLHLGRPAPSSAQIRARLRSRASHWRSRSSLIESWREIVNITATKARRPVRHRLKTNL